VTYNKINLNHPSEIMVKIFLPSIRGLISHKLHAIGYSQSKIAFLLGVTQASVSMYLEKDSSIFKAKIYDLGIQESDLNSYEKMLTEDITRGRIKALYTLSSIWHNILSRGIICSAHRKESSIFEDCDVCMQVYDLPQINYEKSKVIREIERAAELIENSYNFHLVMPEVSSNIVMAVQLGKTEADVAAFPGRMVKIRGRVKHRYPAEFGASQHMSRMLLAAIHHNPESLAAINIKYDSNIKDFLSRKNSVITFIQSKKQKITKKDDLTVSAFKSKLDSAKMNTSNYYVDEGGEGLEPITYIFGRNATEVTKMALEIADNLSINS
jgi:predicted fused transcriptional regulator/phosphomethylpyrimidine kinase/predicted transcriptional regulator